MTATRDVQCIPCSPRLHLAFELSWNQWKLAFTIGHGQPPRLRTVAARDRKAGSKVLLRMLVELAWGWLRWQPDSELSRWYERRFAHNGKRARKMGIVALARKLLIALWRYVAHGEMPAGARLLSWRAKVNAKATGTGAAA